MPVSLSAGIVSCRRYRLSVCEAPLTLQPQEQRPNGSAYNSDCTKLHADPYRPITHRVARECFKTYPLVINSTPHSSQLTLFAYIVTVCSMKLTQIIKCIGCKGRGTQTIADAKAMRARREKKGVSVRGMAKRIKISAPFLSDIETGRRSCPDYVLKAYQKL